MTDPRELAQRLRQEGADYGAGQDVDLLEAGDTIFALLDERDRLREATKELSAEARAMAEQAVNLAVDLDMRWEQGRAHAYEDMAKRLDEVLGEA